jgi:pyruvate dehydrogenase E1 component
MNIQMNHKIKMLRALEQKITWLACWTIHNANHLRESKDGLKVGGHQASSASLSSIMTSLYFDVLRPEDRVAVKPHASPIFHAIQYLFGKQTLQKLKDFRAFGGLQSYPSRTKDTDDIDFSTGSVGLGVAQTLFSSLIQDYVRSKEFGKDRPEGRMIALVGDAELDEGNIYEALLEGTKHNLRNCWCVIDYNRQSLDSVISEGASARFVKIFEAFGWDIIELKYGRLQEDAFKEAGGEKLRHWIDHCSNGLYSALSFQGGAAWRKRLAEDFKDHKIVLDIFKNRSDAELSELMCNLGGHDIGLLSDTFNGIDHDRPTCFIAYTIKGYGLPLAGHKDNHSGQMNLPQITELQKSYNIAEGAQWDKFAGMDFPIEEIEQFLKDVAFNTQKPRQFKAAQITLPDNLDLPAQTSAATQEVFGKILANIAKGTSDLAERIVTTSPDVSVSTNLGGWINRRGIFSTKPQADIFHDEKVMSMQKWEMKPEGQHLELGIAENNLFIMLSAAGLAAPLLGERLFPIGTLYDPFICRGLDAMNYACYQDARFMLVATPSGVTLSPEGGAHQSVNTPLIGMAQDGLSYFEPSYADELSAIMTWGFGHLQDDEEGGSVYLRLSTRKIEQPTRQLTEQDRESIIQGAYWLRGPESSTDIVIIYSGVMAPEAIKAAGMLAEDRRGVAVLAVTSADRLFAGQQKAEALRQRGDLEATSHIEQLMQQVPRDAGLVTIIDGHPATLSWIGGVQGHMVKALGVEKFGQSGNLIDIYEYYGLNANAIVHAVGAVKPGRPLRYSKPLL